MMNAQQTQMTRQQIVSSLDLAFMNEIDVVCIFDAQRIANDDVCDFITNIIKHDENESIFEVVNAHTHEEYKIVMHNDDFLDVIYVTQ